MSKAIARPKAILFDWDNTLVDTWRCIGKATNLTREAMGLQPWTNKEMRKYVAGSLRDTFPIHFGNRWEEARDIFYREFKAHHIAMLDVLPNSEDMLRFASEKGIRLGVVSNKTGEYLRDEATHRGWTKYFGRLEGAQDAARDKPAVDPVHLALKDGGIVAGPDVWFVGDAPIDVTCGRAAGCTTLVYGHNDHPKHWELDETSRADHYILNHNALISFIQSTL